MSDEATVQRVVDAAPKEVGRLRDLAKQLTADGYDEIAAGYLAEADRIAAHASHLSSWRPPECLLLKVQAVEPEEGGR